MNGGANATAPRRKGLAAGVPRASLRCETHVMPRKFTLIEGSGGTAELSHVLEEMDARDAIERLRAMARQRKAAANSVLAVVAQAPSEGRPADPAAQNTNGPA